MFSLTRGARLFCTARSLSLLQRHITIQAARSPVLTKRQISEFDRDGFVVVSDLLTAKEKNDLVKFTAEVEAWPETPGKWMQFFESYKGARMLCRTEKYLDYHAGLHSLIMGKITDAVSDAIGERAILFKEKINFKFPGGAGFKPHQDAPAYVSFNQRFHVTALVSIDPANESNGCLEAVRGEHKKGMFPHPDGVLDPAITKKYEDDKRWEPLATDTGTVVIFNSFVPHRSGPNRSSKPRRIHYLTFNPASDGDFRQAYYEQKRRMFPPDIERLPDVDYSEGAKIFNVANPIPTKKSSAGARQLI